MCACVGLPVGRRLFQALRLALYILWISPTCVAVLITANVVLLPCLMHLPVVSSLRAVWQWCRLHMVSRVL